MDPNEQLNRILELVVEVGEAHRGCSHTCVYNELADRIRDLDVHLSNNGSFPDKWDSYQSLNSLRSGCNKPCDHNKPAYGHCAFVDCANYRNKCDTHAQGTRPATASTREDKPLRGLEDYS